MGRAKKIKQIERNWQQDNQVQVQGDVILRKITELPKGLNEFNGETKILQQSEITGHHHQFKPTDKVTLFYEGDLEQEGVKFITPNKQKYIKVDEPSMLYHGKLFTFDPNSNGTGDHLGQVVEPGLYQVDIVREWNYDYHETRRVID